MNIDIKEKIIEYVSNNIIATLSFVFLLFGGFIFFIYYLYIQYLPDLNLIGSVTLLIFVSSTGLLLLLSTIFMFTMPGVFWHSSVETFFNEIAALCDGKINKVTWFVVPIVFMYMSIFASIFIGNRFTEYILMELISIFFIINFIGMFFLFDKGKKSITNLNPIRQQILKKYKKEYAEFAFLSCSSSFISIFPIFILGFIFLKEYQQELSTFIISFICLTIYIIVSNLLVVFMPSNVNKIYWFFVLGLMSFIVVTLYTDRTVTFPKIIMKTYKLGNIEASPVVLDKQGCNIINQHIDFYQTKSNKNNQVKQVKIENDLCVFPKIYILSKLGKEAYVEVNMDPPGEKEKIRFTLPSSSIVSYNPIN